MKILKSLTTKRACEKFALYHTIPPSDTCQIWLYLSAPSLSSFLSISSPLQICPATWQYPSIQTGAVPVPAYHSSKTIETDVINKSAAFLTQLACVNNSVETVASLTFTYGDIS